LNAIGTEFEIQKYRLFPELLVIHSSHSQWKLWLLQVFSVKKGFHYILLKSEKKSAWVMQKWVWNKG